jgi:hypothetical protein
MPPRHCCGSQIAKTFLKDVAALLGRHPTDDDVTEAIAAVIGVLPHDTHLGNNTGGQHGPNSSTRR